MIFTLTQFVRTCLTVTRCCILSHLEELFVFCGVGVVVRGGGGDVLLAVVVIVVAEAAQRIAIRVAECGGAGGVHATCNGERGLR